MVHLKKIAKSQENSSSCDERDTGNINFDLSPRDVVGPSHETNASMNSLLSQLQSLHLKVDQPEKQKTKPNIVINTEDLSSFVNDKNVHELLLACRSIEMILSFSPCFTIKENSSEGLFCMACESILKYNFDDGMSFNSDEMLPQSFSHLKESVKRHTQNPTHMSGLASKKQISKQNEILYKQSKEAAINCASAAYSGHRSAVVKRVEHISTILLVNI